MMVSAFSSVIFAHDKPCWNIVRTLNGSSPDNSHPNKCLIREDFTMIQYYSVSKTLCVSQCMFCSHTFLNCRNDFFFEMILQ
jgi:hypothetical protein